ncbi:MAG: diguanylate cyclase [Trueperaceae bacterium]|nr:diguanylate cyclase [Trueperaceae bacterium]
MASNVSDETTSRRSWARNTRRRLELFTELARQRRRSEPEQCLGIATEGLELFAALEAAAGDTTFVPGPEQRAELLVVIGHCYDNLRDYSQAKHHFERADAIYESFGDDYGRMQCLYQLSGLYYRLSDYDATLEDGYRALGFARQFGSVVSQADAEVVLGHAYRVLGLYPQALDMYEACLHHYQAAEDPRASFPLKGLGVVYEHLGQADTARRYYQNALEMQQAAGFVREAAMTRSALGNWALLYGDLAEAERELRASLEVLQAERDHYNALPVLIKLGETALKAGDTRSALRYVQQGLALPIELLNPWHQALALLTLARIYRQRGDLAATLSHAGQSIDVAVSAPPSGSLRRVQSDAHALLAELHHEQGDAERALEQFRSHYDLDMEILRESGHREARALMIAHDAERARQDREIYELRNVELVQEVADRRDAEQKLAAAKAEIEQKLGEKLNILESIADGFFALDRDWRIVYVNHRAELLFNRPRGELLGQNYTEVMPQAVGTIFERRYREAFETQQPLQFEAEGTLRDVCLEVRVYPDESGLTVYLLDISERKAADAERARAEAALFYAKETAEARAEQLSVLNRISQAVTQTSDLTTTLERVAQEMTQLFAAAGTTVSLYDLGDRSREIVAGFGAAYRAAEGRQRLELTDDPIAQQVLAGRALILNDLPRHPLLAQLTPAVRADLVRRGLEAQMVIPLFARAQVIGAIDIIDTRPGRRFRTEERDLATTIAGQIAGVIDNARLFDEKVTRQREAEQRVAELSMLNRISQLVAHTLDRDALLPPVCRELVRVFDVASAGISLLGEDRRTLHVVADYAVDDSLASAVGTEIPVEKNNDLVLGQQRGFIVHRNDDMSDTYRQTLDRRGIISVMVVPLVARDTVIGTVGIDSSDPARRFKDSEQALLETIASQIAGAVDNAQLFAQQEAAMKLAQSQSIRDGLTGLFNRRHLDDQLSQEFAKAKRYGTPLSLMLCDIDFFKKVNDTLSHAVGDDVLRTLALLMQDNAREVDVVARYGGEEFVIIFPNTPLASAVAVSERIRQRAEAYPWHTIHPQLSITLSLGVSDNLEGASFESLTADADAQMYRAKVSGKNRVCYRGQEFDEQSG